MNFKNETIQTEKQSMGNINYKSLDCIINELNGDLIINIFLYLPLNSIGNVRRVCIKWSNISEDPRIWNNFYSMLFNKLLPSESTGELLFKEYYVKYRDMSLIGCFLWAVKCKLNVLLKRIVNEIDESRINAPLIHYLVQYGLHEIIEMRLMKDNSKINKTMIKQGTPLLFAISRNYIEVVKILIQYGADIELKFKDQTALVKSISLRRKEIAEHLLINGANPNIKSNGFTPIYISASKGYPDFLYLLSRYHADANIKSVNGWLPIHIASHNGHFGLIRKLIFYNTNINSLTDDGKTSLYLAAIADNNKTVEVLITLGADPSIYSSDQKTPLYIASQNGHYKTVRELLKHKNININQINEGLYTALHAACASGHLEVAKILIQNGAIFILDPHELGSALHNGNYNIIEHFIDNVHDKSYAFYLACRYSHLNIALLLISHNANPCVIINGKNLLYLAINENYDPAIISLLLKIVPHLLLQQDSNGIAPLDIIYKITSAGILRQILEIYKPIIVNSSS